MSRKRVRTYGGERKQVWGTPTRQCDLCRKPMHQNEVIPVLSGKEICFPCGWMAVEGMARVYKAPEVTTMDRIRFRRENGHEGWRREDRKPARIEPGWVYYIRMGDTIKIGYATDVAKRMRAYPPNAELLAAHPGTELLEKQMHQKFKPHLVRGREWFAPADEVMAHVASVVEQFGDPSHMAYEFTRPKTQEEKVAAMFAKPHSTADIAQGAHYAG